MDELLEFRYKKPTRHPYPIGSSVVFSVEDIREVIGHRGKRMVYLRHKDGAEVLYNIEELKYRPIIKLKS
jgi:hypothetical protein